MQAIHFSESDPTTPVRRVERQADRKASILSGKRVVIVEDEGITQMQLRRILTLLGLDVADAATSGPRGVEAVLRAKPDLVLMDIRMPGDYDGLEAAHRILAVYSVCIVMLTAFAEPEYKDQARQIGACGYVVKPIDQDTLVPQLEAAYKMWQPQ